MSTSGNEEVTSVRKHAVCSAAAQEAQRDADLPFVAYTISRARVPIIPMSPNRDWMKSGAGLFAAHCLPLRMANQYGWSLLNPRRFTASWDGGCADGAMTLTPEQEGQRLIATSHFGHGIITWHVPFLFRLPEGWNLRARGPVNQPKDGVCALEGLIEADWNVASFTMNWVFTRPGTVVFEESEVFCVVYPEQRLAIERFAPVIRALESEPDLMFAHRKWAALRSENVKKKQLNCMEKHYSKGTHPAAELGWKATSHCSHLKVRGFTED